MPTVGVPIVGCQLDQMNYSIILTATRASLTILFLYSLSVGQNRLSADDRYRKAVEDAARPTPAKRMPLYELAVNQKTVLVTSLKPFAKTTRSCSFSEIDLADLRRGGIYVFVPTELASVIEKNPDQYKDDAEGRLKELLGVKPNDQFKCVLEIEVDPKNLIRPSLSLSISGQGRDYFFSFKWGSDYPFTGLGYTCDWHYGDGCRYGLSEFNIPPGEGWITQRSYTLAEYLMKLKSKPSSGASSSK